jgi:hypothetical protein
VIVEDVRRDDTFMRVTWHEESAVFVVSHWRGEVCVAATRVPVHAAPDLIQLFVRGLAESTGGPPAAVSTPPSRRQAVLHRVRRLLIWRPSKAA